MKHINIPVEDKEFEMLMKRKGSKTWRDFIMEINKEER